jgi:prepilin-type N-terminal cleavage/methylation domain-containing protein/prepilin-type processing-associated H-X9-DG protein
MTADSFHHQPPRRLAGPLRRAYTLVELLVVVGIIAVLLAILIPAFVSARNESKAFVCMDHLRSVAFEFRLFADRYGYANRGESEVLYKNRFSAMDFQESLYVTCEFWSAPPSVSEFYRRGQKPILCPSGPMGLGRHTGAPSIADGGVAPRDRVNYAMNRRLIYAPVMLPGVPYPVQRFVTIGERILDHANVPIFFDVNARAAVEAGKKPFFSAPPGMKESGPSIYDDNQYWFPARRHNNRLTIAFVGGHVVSTDQPLKDPTWDWEYYPELTP